jgi:hypothetical protein
MNRLNLLATTGRPQSPARFARETGRAYERLAIWLIPVWIGFVARLSP